MKLLLDTNVLLWWWANTNRIGPQARDAISDGANEVFVSPASLWEIEIKRSRGKLDAPDDLIAEVAADGFLPLLVGLRHAVMAGRLPPHHNDPFDRLLIAQALDENLTIVSADSVFPLYTSSLLHARQ